MKYKEGADEKKNKRENQGENGMGQGDVGLMEK